MLTSPTWRWQCSRCWPAGPCLPTTFRTACAGCWTTPSSAFPTGLSDRSSSLKGWFERALPLETRRHFGTALEAQLALEEILKKERSYAPSQSALKSLLQRHAACRPEEQAASEAAAPRKASGARNVIDFTPSPASQPAPGASQRSRGSSAPRTPVRRLTPEEEEAEEILALEAELARIAQAEAAEAATAAAGAIESAEARLEVVVSRPEPVASTPIASIAELSPAGLAAEAIEIEIVTFGQELPVLDVAALSDDTTTIVVSRTSEDIASFLPGSSRRQGAHRRRNS